MKKVFFLLASMIFLFSNAAFGWTKIYANDSNGNTTFGSLSALTNAINQGADVKISANNINGVGSYRKCDIVIVNQDTTIACLLPSAIGVNEAYAGTTFGFQSSAYHDYFMVNTKGQSDESRWYIAYPSSSAGDTKANYSVIWFVQ